VRLCERNNSADTKVTEERKGGGAPDARAESVPLQLMMKTMVRQVVPLQPMKVHGGADIHLQPVEATHAGAGGCLQEAVTPWGLRAGAGCLQDLRTCGERSPCRSRFSGRVCDPMGDSRWSCLFLKDCTLWEGTHAGAAHEELQPVGRTHAGEVCGELSCERDLTLKQGKSMRSPPPEEEGASETTCDELIVTPIPRPPAPLGGRRERNGSEAAPGKMGGVGGRCFKIWFYFLLPHSDLIGDELNSLFSPSSVCFVCDSNW